MWESESVRGEWESKRVKELEKDRRECEREIKRKDRERGGEEKGKRERDPHNLVKASTDHILGKGCVYAKIAQFHEDGVFCNI